MSGRATVRVIKVKKQGENRNPMHRRIVAADCPYCASGHSTSLRRLERAQAALTRAIIADHQFEPGARNFALMECRRLLIALNRDVEPTQPFSDVLGTVFNVGVQRIEASMRAFEPHIVELVQSDLDDLLNGFRR